MATREQLIEDFADHKYATGEKFVNLINSMKAVQEPVADPAASGTSLSFIDSIEQDADGKITATKKTLDLANAHELNPFKGWWKTGDTLPTSGFDGAYLYFKDTTQSPAVTTIYRWNGTAYADTGTVVDESNVQVFGSGQQVNSVKIKDENGEEVQGDADVLSAEAGRIIVNTTMELVESANLLNPSTVTPNKVVKRTDGTITNGSNSGLTPYIPIPDEGLICNHTLKTSGATDGAGCVYKFVDGEYFFVAYIGQSQGQGSSAVVSKVNSDYQYARFNLYWGTTPEIDFAECGVYKGTTLPSPFIPYEAPYYLMKKVSVDDIADGSITFDKIAFKKILHGKNLVDVSTLKSGYYGSAGGVVAEGQSPTYMFSPKIAVEAGKTYHLSLDGDNRVVYGSGSVYICLFKDGVFVSNLPSNTMQITIPDDDSVNQIGFTVQNSQYSAYGDLQLEEGTTRTTYEAYWVKEVIDEDVLPPTYIPDDSITTQKIADNAITQEKLANGITVSAAPNKFNGWSNESNSVTAGSSLAIEGKIFRCRKGLQVSAVITGSIEEVEFNIGGVKVYLTPTSIGNASSPYAHGLTLGNITTVVINCGDDENVTGNTKIRVINDAGETYEKTSYDLRLIAESISVKNNNTSNSLGIKLSVFNKDLNKRIWMFGDSYFSYIDPARWTNQIMHWGYINFLMNAQGGETAEQALVDLNLLLESGSKPSYIVWCLGMNNGSDENGAVNSTWLGITQSLITICNNIGAQLILATIPSTPTASHVKLNEWVRNSGYRYIDFAAAVEDGVGTYPNYWRLWGDDTTTPDAGSLLSSDKVHPTQYGAIELAARVLVDFPEISIITD